MVPSEDYSHGPPCLHGLFRMTGDRPRAHSRAVKKKTMKTKINKNQKTESGLQNRIAQSSTDKTTEAAAPAAAGQTPPLIPLDYEKRREYRSLPTASVLSLLQTEAPRFFDIAEVVGKWVWIQFSDKQPREVTAALSQLGFHWNNKRQAWQHPCGAFTMGSDSNPRDKYQTYFPADAKAA